MRSRTARASIRGWWRNLGTGWKVVSPILVAGILGPLVLFLLTVRTSGEQVTRAALERASGISGQIHEIRSASIQGAVEIVDDPDTQAELIHRLNRVFEELEDHNVRLFSEQRNAGERDLSLLDSFDAEAIAELGSRPDEPFWRIEDFDGVTSLRYATTERVLSSLCVDCHNQIELDGRSDWGVGQVGWVLEVILPIEEALQTFRSDALKIGAGIVVLVLPLMALLGVIVSSSVTRPINDLVSTTSTVARGDLTHRLEVTSGDEVGRIRAALNEVIEAMTAAVGAIADHARRLTQSSERLNDLSRGMHDDGGNQPNGSRGGPWEYGDRRECLGRCGGGGPDLGRGVLRAGGIGRAGGHGRGAATVRRPFPARGPRNHLTRSVR